MLRRDGKAPQALGVVDDLPNRVTYEQLNALAGMVGKVRKCAGTNTILLIDKVNM